MDWLLACPFFVYIFSVCIFILYFLIARHPTSIFSFSSHKRKYNDFKLSRNRDRFDLKDRVFIVTFFQLVIGDLRAEVMDVMETDIACEPLQNFGKFIEGTSIHACLEEFPIFVTFPIGGIKIMLDIEQPYSCTASHEQNGQFNQKISLPADVIDRPADKCQQCNIRPDHAVRSRLPESASQKRCVNTKTIVEPTVNKINGFRMMR